MFSGVIKEPIRELRCHYLVTCVCNNLIYCIFCCFNILVGEPIHVTKIKEPSVEEVNDFHQKYIDGLISIFEKHKSKYGISEDKHLEIC